MTAKTGNIRICLSDEWLVDRLNRLTCLNAVSLHISWQSDVVTSIPHLSCCINFIAVANEVKVYGLLLWEGSVRQNSYSKNIFQKNPCYAAEWWNSPTYILLHAVHWLVNCPTYRPPRPLSSLCEKFVSKVICLSFMVTKYTMLTTHDKADRHIIFLSCDYI